jgi:hypothetical protein
MYTVAHLLNSFAGLCCDLCHHWVLQQLWCAPAQRRVCHTDNALAVRHTNQLALRQQRVQLDLQGNRKQPVH